MKKLYFLIFFTSYFAHSQDVLWEKSYGGKHADYLFDAQPTADYGFILAGSSLSDKTGNKTDNNLGDLDYWIWKMDETGNLDWQKSFGGTGFDLLQSVQSTIDGGFVLAGTSSSGNAFQKNEDCKGLTDFWVIKLTAAGVEQWQRTIGGSGTDELLCAFQTRDGGYILGGSSSSSASVLPNTPVPAAKGTTTTKADLYSKSEKSRGNMDYWVVKLNKDGVIEWQKTYGGQYADLLKSMEQTSDNGYILAGYSNSPVSGEKTAANKGMGDYWILKITDTGEIQWQDTYGAEGDDQPYVIHQTSDEGYILGGNSNSRNPLTSLGGIVSNGTDCWVLKLDKEGGVVWSKTYDFGKTDILTSLVVNTDKTYLIGGHAKTESKRSLLSDLAGKAGISKEKDGINDYIALKIDDKGEELWSKTIGSGGEDILRKLIETRDGGYLMAGTSDSNSSKDKNSNIGASDFWVVKLKDKTKAEKVKASMEAMPNPAATYTNVIIGYDFKEGTATLVDISGRILQHFSISSRTVPIDLSKYAEGIYIIDIKTDVKTESVKVIKSVN